jgi:ribose-phosphate pyrophosphokinase
MIYLNNVLVTPTHFPDKTTQVWKLDNETYKLSGNFNIVKWDFQDEAEFFTVAQLKTLLDSYKQDTRLYIKYLPYGRQDKPVSNTSTFALTTFANLLNSLKFDEVVITDPHSVVALDLIHNSRATYPIDVIEQVIWETKSNLICYPDYGATTKYKSEYHELRLPIIYGEKVRDQLTGNITSYSISGRPSQMNVLIVDDICDYGRTFTMLAKHLQEGGASEINLFVTHGLFSGGIKVLKDAGINRVFDKNGEHFEDHNKQVSYKPYGK